MQNRNPAAPTTSYTIDNPEEFARNMLRLFEEIERAMFGMLARSDAKISPYSGASINLLLIPGAASRRS